MSALPILFDHVVKLINYLVCNLIKRFGITSFDLLKCIGISLFYMVCCSQLINKAEDRDQVIILFQDMHEVVTRDIMEDHLLK